MKTVSRKVEILWKYNPSTFENINKKVIGEVYRRIGGSNSAINKLLQQSSMLQMLMPEILGIDPNSNDVNWEKTVKKYWDSLTVEVASGGKRLETGLQFDIDDLTRERYIQELREKLTPKSGDKVLKTDEELADYVMGFTGDKPNVTEAEKWKYGRPIKVEDYLLWRYIENYSHVANKAEDINKSANIRFYLSTDDDKRRAQKLKNKTKQAAIKAYNKFTSDATEEDYNDLLIVLDPLNVIDIVQKTSLDDKQLKVMDLVNSEPAKFSTTVNNKHLKTEALINKYIAFGIFKKLPNSSTVMDANDSSIIVGHTMDECIGFMSDKKNEPKLNEYLAKFKSISK